MPPLVAIESACPSFVVGVSARRAHGGCRRDRCEDPRCGGIGTYDLGARNLPRSAHGSRERILAMEGFTGSSWQLRPPIPNNHLATLKTCPSVYKCHTFVHNIVIIDYMTDTIPLTMKVAHCSLRVIVTQSNPGLTALTAASNGSS